MKSATIVIPTHNRYERLRNLLSSIRKNWGEYFESVIVVDDSTQKQDLEGYDDIHLRHIRFDPRIFVSKAKNVGWRASRTELVFFVDDDNVLGSGTAPPLLETVSDPAVGAVMPGVLYKSRPELVWAYATPFKNARLGMNLVGRNSLRNPSLENRLLRTDALPNASMAKRSALEQVGGFDERLIVSSSLDLCQRMKAAGWRVVSNTASLIYHDVELPNRPGYWAAHGSTDPELVRYNLRDWFLVMKTLHPGDWLFRPRYTVRSMTFVGPNLLAYLMRGGSRAALVKSLVRGYVEGMKVSGSAETLGRA
jgi:GT2 family glycosyltransferase